MTTTVKSDCKYPKLSVIVLVLNSEKYVERVYKSLEELDYPDYELIFVDGGSTDSTLEKLQQYNVTIVSAVGTKIAEARNRGIEHATGEFIAFTDHDCVVDSKWARILVDQLLSDPKIGCVGGPNCLVGDGSPKSEAIVYALNSWLGSAGSAQFLRYSEVRKISAVAACSIMFRRQTLEKTGSFDKNLLYCEDGEICYRINKAGYNILFVPTAIVHHDSGLNSFKKMWTYFFSWGLGRMYEARQKKHLVSKASLALIAGSVSFLIIGILGLFYSPLFLTFLILVGVYFASLGFSSICLTVKSRGAIKLRYVFFAYIVEHVAYLLGLFSGLVTKRSIAKELHNIQYENRSQRKKLEIG